jgi:predicted transcriptional regulator of viral defense system
MPRTHAYDAIHELALDQHGVFTTAQARDLGVDPRSVAAMGRRGRVSRLSFGVYQDLGAPITAWTEYMSACFWPYGATGVLSHETALSIMELSDVSPARIHLTIPSGHRIRRSRPPVLVLHRADLPEEDIGSVEGVPVTRAPRTIRDCVQCHLGPGLLRQAIEDGVRSGWLTAREATSLRHDLLEKHG